MSSTWIQNDFRTSSKRVHTEFKMNSTLFQHQFKPSSKWFQSEFNVSSKGGHNLAVRVLYWVNLIMSFACITEAKRKQNGSKTEANVTLGNVHSEMQWKRWPRPLGNPNWQGVWKHGQNGSGTEAHWSGKFILSIGDHLGKFPDMEMHGTRSFTRRTEAERKLTRFHGNGLTEIKFPDHSTLPATHTHIHT